MEREKIVTCKWCAWTTSVEDAPSGAIPAPYEENGKCPSCNIRMTVVKPSDSIRHD